MGDKKKEVFGYQHNPAAHSSIMCIVGCYLVYIGGQVGYGAFHGDESMPMWMSIVFAVLFVILGLGVVGYGYMIWHNSRKRAEEAEKKEKLEAGGEEKK